MLEGVKQKWGWEVIYVVNWIHVYSFIHRLVRSVPPCLSGGRRRGRGGEGAGWAGGWLRVLPRQKWPKGRRFPSRLRSCFFLVDEVRLHDVAVWLFSFMNITSEWMNRLTRGCAAEYLYVNLVNALKAMPGCCSEVYSMTQQTIFVKKKVNPSDTRAAIQRNCVFTTIPR